jgi:hypothetical protein
VIGLRPLELLAVLGTHGTELGLQRCHLRGQAGVLGVGLLVALLVLAERVGDLGDDGLPALVPGQPGASGRVDRVVP